MTKKNDKPQRPRGRPLKPEAEHKIGTSVCFRPSTWATIDEYMRATEADSRSAAIEGLLRTHPEIVRFCRMRGAM
jgi:hypothetical protein